MAEGTETKGGYLERRYLVFREKSSRHFLCVASARSARHALQVARQYHRLSRSAYATLEQEENFLSPAGSGRGGAGEMDQKV